MEAIVKTILARFDKAKTDRQNYESVWQDISDYVIPYRGNFQVVDTIGSNTKRKKVFDTTIEQANTLLASSLYGGLTNPSTKWFQLGSKSTIAWETMKWLEIASEYLLKIFNSADSNFSLQSHEFFLSLCSYGTAVMFVEDDIDEVKFSTIHLSEVFILEDKSGVVDTVFRKFNMTLRQAVQMWGLDALSDKSQKLYEKDKDTKIEILHCVYPKTDADMVNEKFSHVSYYIEVQHSHIISKGKFSGLPYIVARFSKLTGEVYGRSPAWSAMPNVKMVNAMKESQIKATQLQAQPPLMIADDGVLNPLKIGPNSIIVGGLSMDYIPKIQPLNVGSNVQLTEAAIQSVQKTIRDSFYIDAFIFRDGPMMTATEAKLRQQEQLRLLAPHIGRIQSEFLQPLISKTLDIVVKMGILGNVPKELIQDDYEIEYVSPLALLQRSTDVQAIQNLMANVAPIAQLNPAVMDRINFDAAVKKMAIDLGVPLSVLFSDEEMAETRAQQQQQMQMQQMLQAGQQVTGMAKDLSGLIPPQ
jgi:hypothetical protein